MTTRGLYGDLRHEGAQTLTEPVPVTLAGLYGGYRIVAGAQFLESLDPAWWREDGMLPVSLTALQMADPHRCVLAYWAAQHLPAPASEGTHPAAPYDRARHALRLSAEQAQALGFTGVDADLLTPGWRRLILALRTSYDQRAIASPARPPRRHLPRWPTSWPARES